ncbi:MAG: hypothetical protein LBE15_03235 [Burkholderiales bacterium]|jgi:hypothetical protein|nr:hypothetical protein [Burkholderiales bacterium]
MGIVFQRGRRTQKFWFFEPFIAAKHGNPSALQAMQASFLLAAHNDPEQA